MSDFFKKMKSVFLEPTGTETENAEDTTQDDPENGKKKIVDSPKYLKHIQNRPPNILM
jgi:hypothetical protein